MGVVITVLIRVIEEGEWTTIARLGFELPEEVSRNEAHMRAGRDHLVEKGVVGNFWTTISSHVKQRFDLGEKTFALLPEENE